MSVSMAVDAGVAGDGARPGDRSSAAPSPAPAQRCLSVVTSDRPSQPTAWRAFFRCVLAEYGNYKETTQRRLIQMSAGEFD